MKVVTLPTDIVTPKGVAKHPLAQKCQVLVAVPAKWRGRNRSWGGKCCYMAKYSIDGIPCCLRHAEKRALEIAWKGKPMSHETIYTCDRCREAVSGCETMWEVKVQYQSLDLRERFGNTSYSQHAVQEWCKRCMETAGIIRPAVSTKKDEAPPAMSLDKLVDALIEQKLNERGV